MRHVIIGYRYSKSDLHRFLKECEKNNRRLQDPAFTYEYDGGKWIMFYDRQEDIYEGYSFHIEDSYTTDELVEELLSDSMGEFWIVEEDDAITKNNWSKFHE